MTLPELLISVVLTGVLMTAITASITVVLAQGKNTLGRANNARSEQSVNIWLPTDLASAEGVDNTGSAKPCGDTTRTPPDPPCPAGADVGGSNAIMLTWTGSQPGAGGVAVPTQTRASYRYVQVGTEYQLIRVACTSVNGAPPTCVVNTVLHDLDAPPIGIHYTPGVDAPSWVMVVSQALNPADTSGSTPAPTDDPTFKSKNGQRVLVTINGGGGLADAGGGTQQISLSAGGTERSSTLATSSVSFDQTLTAARSRCGGNYGMIIDTSGSIGATNMGIVRTAISSMVDTFAGTPVKLELSQFSTLAKILGADITGTRYFDMLKESDVSDLKKYINGGTTSANVAVPALASTGATNYEDALYRMFRKTDGTIQAMLPQKVIFFTDGIPNYTRLNAGGTTAQPAATAFPDDTGLAVANGSDYAQVAWNRANRVAREFGVQVDFIGVFVGADTTASSNWVDVHAGYHLENWQKGFHNVYERAFHNDYQRGSNVTWQRGSHTDYQRGANIVWEKGYHDDYQRGNNLIFEYSNTGLTFERFSGGSWSSQSASNYFNNNTTSDSTDNWRVRVTGTISTTSWSSITLTQYKNTNTAVGTGDGFRARVSGSASSWTSITSSEYSLSNTTSDATDGYQIAPAYSSPYNSWESTTQSNYSSNNSTTSATDGWRTRETSPSAGWISVSSSEYNASNTTSDATDGWQIATLNTAPYSSWTNSTQALYDAGNTTTDSTDGWRINLSSATSGSTTWTSVPVAQFDASNTTTDSTDGWRVVKTYSAPFSIWEATTQGAYAGANSTSDESDGWRTYVSYTSPFDTWESTDEATYIANNVGTDPTDGSDGWLATKVYVSPYTAYDATRTYSRSNRDILGQLIDPAGLVLPTTDADGNVDNAEVANMYSTTDWTKLEGALKAIALAQCGGTLTLQTRVGGTTPAGDTFTYVNTLDATKVETGQSKRSGTFDFSIPTGGSVTVDIHPLIVSSLVHYTPAGWSCKAAGVAVTPVPVDIPNTPWDGIRLTVRANDAVSCIQNVTYIP
jgi:hypothetical protein